MLDDPLFLIVGFLYQEGVVHDAIHVSFRFCRRAWMEAKKNEQQTEQPCSGYFEETATWPVDIVVHCRASETGTKLTRFFSSLNRKAGALIQESREAVSFRAV
jgi:hypothetical protein